MTTITKLTNVFVYGTLKKGDYNHRLLEKAVWVGIDSLCGYQMYSLGAYPCIVETGDIQDCVHGEVWAVTKEQLASLDMLEGYVEGREGNLYERVFDSTEKGYPVQTYVMESAEHGERIRTGTW